MSKEFELPDFDEAALSQVPALLELVNLGYTYLSRAKVAELRDGPSQYILREIAFEGLRKINAPAISDKSIRDEIFKAEQQIDMGGFVESPDLSLRVPKAAFPATLPKFGERIEVDGTEYRISQVSSHPRSPLLTLSLSTTDK